MRSPGSWILGALATAALLVGTPARACSICGCGDPLLAASDPAAITGILRLQLDTEYLRVDAGTDGQPGLTDQLTQWSYRFNVAYRPFEDLALTATLPLVSKSMRTTGGGANLMGTDLTGLGDVEIGARYTLWKSIQFSAQRVHELALTAGAMMPTGGHDARDADGALIDPHAQLGTGGWGPFLGIAYRFEQGSWLGFANVSGRLRTEATYADGSRYKFGDALLWSLHGQYRPIRSLALDLGIDGRYAAKDRATATDGTVDDAVVNTGGTVLSASPGVYFNPLGNAWIFVRAQIPFFKSLFGEQNVLPSVVTGLQVQVL